jgi:hypothetical protein
VSKEKIANEMAQEPAGQVKHLSNDVIVEWFDATPADDTFVYLSTQQPVQEPVGSDYTVLITRLAYALKKANPESDLPIKATEFLKRKGHTFDPLRDMQEPVRQDSWISVEERLPAIGQPVLGLCDDVLSGFRRVDGGDGTWLWEYCNLLDESNYEADDDYQVSSWMPLTLDKEVN